jgi:hypothetical protein
MNGQGKTPAQIGMAVYELVDTVKLLSASIFDDVYPPTKTV